MKILRATSLGSNFTGCYKNECKLHQELFIYPSSGKLFLGGGGQVGVGGGGGCLACSRFLSKHQLIG